MLNNLFENLRRDFNSNLCNAQIRGEVSLQYFILGQLSALDRLGDEIRMMQPPKTGEGGNNTNEDKQRIMGFGG